MRYVAAAVACLLITAVFLGVKVALYGPSGQVGMLPLVGLFFVLLFTWQAITRRKMP